MWWPFAFLADAFRDYILFVLVDSVAKGLLKDARYGVISHFSSK